MTLRHDLLTSRFATTLQCVNAVTRVEPRSFGQTSRSRPDIAVYWPTSSPHLSPSQLLDVTYVHIPAPTYRLRSPAAVLQARATQKSTKYAALAAMEGAAFFPLVVATSGGLSKATLAYLKRVSKHLGHFHRPSSGRFEGALDDGVPAPPGFLPFVKRLVAASTAKCNAWLVASGLAMQRS